MYQYPTDTLSKLCPVGQTLRAKANFQATCIRSDAWLRDGVTPLERSNMLELARMADGEQYQTAFQAWREHYHNCPACQEALTP